VVPTQAIALVPSEAIALTFIETYNQTAKPFKWTYTGKVLEA
jgi:hypothetical protein